MSSIDNPCREKREKERRILWQENISDREKRREGLVDWLKKSDVLQTSKERGKSLGCWCHGRKEEVRVPSSSLLTSFFYSCPSLFLFFSPACHVDEELLLWCFSFLLFLSLSSLGERSGVTAKNMKKEDADEEYEGATDSSKEVLIEW